MVPKGWNIIKIEEFAEVKTGGTPSRQNPSYWDGSIPWMASGEIHQKYIKNTAEFITEEGLNNSNARWLPEKTVMIALNGQGKTRGSVGILQTSVTCNQSLAGFIVNHQICHPEYLLFYLDDKYQFLRDLSGDEGRNGLNLKLLREIEVSLPPLSEQKRIAEILSSVDEAIASTQAVIDQTRKVKQGLLQQLLTRGIGHTRFKESAIGKIPEEWKVVNFASLAQVGPQNGIYKSKDDYGSGIPMIDMGDIFSSNIIKECERRCVRLTKGEQEKFALEFGDLLFARRSLVAEGSGKCSIVGHHSINPVFESSIIRFRLKSDISSSLFYFYYWESPIGMKLRRVITRQVAVSGITGKDLEKLPVALPPLNEQIKITSILESLDEQIASNELEIIHLNSVKKGLMQDLLTGRVRTGVTP
ncbi:restriction endonuclease subunit S [Nostoc sp. LEGE 12450]|uniref:restriction endonuclease subunit S n=1 Tax=Nostoc sp. LEGE 12450 TaxID=1828643 RepID=UPI00187F38DB|nr:restriction endonuclease subunit S [Nostoc sp. LEGE 12450]MBE8989436.1 restriction endonuclease subunit S [Nostoc sp. LEGE 12450]